MLSTGLSTALTIASLILSALAVYLSWAACRIAASGSASSVSVQKLTKLEGELTETHDLIEGLRESLHKMRSRSGMQRLRAERDNAMPDARTDPDGYKRAQRARILATGRLNAKFHGE